MFKYVVKRLLMGCVLFFVITAIVYFLLSIAPGSALDTIASSTKLTKVELEELKASMGLDRPVIVRYALWLKDFLNGDWGTSYSSSQDVLYVISQRIRPSLILTCTGLAIAVVIGIPLGISGMCFMEYEVSSKRIQCNSKRDCGGLDHEYTGEECINTGRCTDWFYNQGFVSERVNSRRRLS